MVRKKLLFFFIILLAVVLRLYRLGEIPTGLEWDEVAIGYDAYSILRTGRDQYGTILPLTFRSLDDYKPPLYVYITVPSIAVFGLNEFSTRLPSAIFGVITVVLVYYLVLEIFQTNKNKYLMAIFSCFFLAISPWHLQFSRAAFEANTALAIIIGSLYFFLKGVEGNKAGLSLSAILFGLSLFTYHSARIITPILIVALFWIYYKKLFSIKKVIPFVIIFSFFLVLFYPILSSKTAQTRFYTMNNLSIDKNIDLSAKKIVQDEKIDAGISGRIFHNRRLSIFNYDNLSLVMINYIKNFSPEFLLLNGADIRHHAPDFGLLYFIDFPLLIIGIIYYLKKLVNRYNLILMILLLIAPIPASLTWESPSAVRSLMMIPGLAIFISLGFLRIYYFFTKEAKLIFSGFVLAYCFFTFWNFGLYLHHYYLHLPIEQSNIWFYGRKEAVEFTENNKDKFNKIIVSSKIDMPLVFWLFYSKYPPEKYLAGGGTISGGFAEERNRFEKYEFRNFNYEEEKQDQRENILLVGIPKDFPSDAKSVKTILYKDGSEAIKIVSNEIQ